MFHKKVITPFPLSNKKEMQSDETLLMEGAASVLLSKIVL
jgi:hypothetical protein